MGLKVSQSLLTSYPLERLRYAAPYEDYSDFNNYEDGYREH